MGVKVIAITCWPIFPQHFQKIQRFPLASDATPRASTHSTTRPRRIRLNGYGCSGPLLYLLLHALSSSHDHATLFNRSANSSKSTRLRWQDFLRLIKNANMCMDPSYKECLCYHSSVAVSMISLLWLIASLLALAPVHQAARETFRPPHLGIRQRLGPPAQDATEVNDPLFIDVSIVFCLQYSY